MFAIGTILAVLYIAYEAGVRTSIIGQQTRRLHKREDPKK